MIRLERDPAFWNAVARHPDVAPHVFLGREAIDFGPWISNPRTLPFASEHGGYQACMLDNAGCTWDLHAMYGPEGWGREANAALKAVLRVLFAGRTQVVTASEVEGWWRSRPPKSFGFRRAADFTPIPEAGAALCTWVLTKAAWEASPAAKRA